MVLVLMIMTIFGANIEELISIWTTLHPRPYEMLVGELGNAHYSLFWYNFTELNLVRLYRKQSLDWPPVTITRYFNDDIRR